MAQEYVAVKVFSMRGKSYKKGDSLDAKDLPASKINQLLDQRWIGLKQQKTTG